MEFVDIVDKITARYRDAGEEKIVKSVNDCILKGGTLTERWLILAEYLEQLRAGEFETYRIALGENEMIIEGKRKWFA